MGTGDVGGVTGINSGMVATRTSREMRVEANSGMGVTTGGQEIMVATMAGAAPTMEIIMGRRERVINCNTSTRKFGR